MQKKQNLTATDLINVGIYTAIYLVVLFTIGLLNSIPFMYPILYFIVPIVAGIPFMLFLIKVDKFGMVTIMSIILGIFWYLMGYTWLAPLVYISCGVVSDLILKIGQYKSFKINIIGFWVFSCGIIGCQMPMWVMTETYMAIVKRQMGVEFATEVAKYMPPWMGFAAIGIILVGSTIGAFLGKKMLKKHFERAGIA